MLQEDLEKYREKAETLSAQLSSFKSQVQSLQASKDTDEAATANRLTNLEESLLRAQEEVRAECIGRTIRALCTLGRFCRIASSLNFALGFPL